MSRYSGMFARLGNQGAFGAFLMLGDPDLETSAGLLDCLVEAGADMIEVGIPFSDPVADGPVIQAAATRALNAGVTPGDCFALLRAFRKRHPDVPVGILTYANLVIARGREAFLSQAAAAGVDSLLIADVPMFEAHPFSAAAVTAGIDPIFIAAPNTPQAVLGQIASIGRGYTYCVARAGVTGADEEIRLDHSALFASLKAHGAAPPILGFGISRPEHVRTALAGGAAGVISGSAIVRLIEQGGDARARVSAFVREMKASTRG
jgi:tryptophan synthase alpha chain